MHNNKNIIHILSIIRNPVGGIRTYVEYTYAGLDYNKYRFTIIAVNNKEVNHIRNALDRFRINLITVDGKYIIFRFLYKLFKILRNDDFHLLHSQGFISGMLTVLANTHSKRPHIITIHQILRTENFPPPFAHLRKKLMAFLIGQADYIQSVSHNAEQNLIEFLPSLIKKKHKLLVIRNGIMLERFLDNKTTSYGSFRKTLGIDRDIYLFGFFGRFMPQKGFIYLIEAVEHLSNINHLSHRFKIIAVNDGAFMRRYKSIIKTKNISDYFIFPGFTKNIANILEEIDALVMPSLWEAYGLQASEAFIMGCPVIASHCIGLREVLEDTPAIIIRKKDPHSIANALMDFMINPDPIRQKTMAFVPKARQRFDAKRTSHELDVLFRKAIKQSET